MTQLSFTIWSVQLDKSLLAFSNEMNGTEASIILQRVALNSWSCSRSRGGLAIITGNVTITPPTHCETMIRFFVIIILFIGHDQRLLWWYPWESLCPHNIHNIKINTIIGHMVYYTKTKINVTIWTFHWYCSSSCSFCWQRILYLG